MSGSVRREEGDGEERSGSGEVSWKKGGKLTPRIDPAIKCHGYDAAVDPLRDGETQ